MPTNIECIYCREIDAVYNNIQEGANNIVCITDHEGFGSVCLYLWVLQTAYFNYRQRCDEADEKTIHEKCAHKPAIISFRYSFLQALSVYDISPTNKLVLGVVGKKSKLFCQALLLKNQGNISICCICWIQICSIIIIMTYCVVYILCC